MNDLERDLKDLFETKATDVQTTPLAPPAVLRRGRRRQAGTVIGGALMTIAAAAVVIGGAAAFLGDRASEPPIMGDREVLPARTATIAGVTVTAPAGWSLLDQWPLGMNVPTETCSTSFEEVTATGGATFQATGSPVPAGNTGDAGTSEPTPAGEAEPTPAGEEDCTPIETLPGGSPLFTLGNVAPQPVATFCPVFEEFGTQAVGPTDVFLYVGFDANADAPAWPVDLGEPTEGPCSAASIVRWSVDDADYLAAAVVGPEASDEDRAALAAAFAGLRFGPPQITASPVIGYVVGAGTEGGIPWRLVAGPALTCESGDACAVQLALITTDPDGSEQAWPVTPPRSGSSIESASQPVGQVTIAFGTAAADVEAVEIVTGDGTTVTPTSVPWPSTLEAFASPEAPVDGPIWWATVPDVASIGVANEDGPTVPDGSEEVPPPDVAGEEPSIAELRLDTRMVGDELVASGDGWEIGMGPRPGENDVIMPRISTGEVESGYYLSLSQGGGQTTPVNGGALSITVLAPDEGPVSVTLDGTGETIYARWMPGPDQFGKDSRWWVLPLPGVGSGLVRNGPDDLPTATSWPPGRPPAAGVVAAAGSFGFGDISWKFAYTSPDCLVLARVAGGDPSIGQTGCLQVPRGDERLVAFAAGDESSLVALIAPGNVMSLDGPGPAGETIYGQCSGSGGFDEETWARHGICAILIPNDVDVTLQPMGWDPDTREDVRLDPLTIRVSDGELVLTDGG